MRRGKNRPQLRRCSFCNKVGHNTATCPLFLPKKNTAAPVVQTKTEPVTKPVFQNKSTINFFVHHTHNLPINSPHVIDLKNHKEDIWEKIQANSPSESTNPLYHFYHKPKNKPVLPVEPLIAEKISLPVVEEAEEKEITEILPVIKTVKVKKEKKKFQWPRPDKWLAAIPARVEQSTQDAARAIENTLHYNFSWRRFCKIAVCAMAVLIIPAQTNSYYHTIKNTAGKITADSTDGFVSLQDSTAAMMNADLPSAQESLTNALQKFETAADTLQNKHRWLSSIATAIPFVREEVESRQNILLAGQKIALGNVYLLKGIAESQANVQDTITERVGIITTHLRSAIPNYDQAMENLSAVKIEALPLEYQAAFKDFRLLFIAIVSDMKNMADLGGVISEVFGGEGQRKYLLVFQNPYELRPTGGFIGSFAILDIKDGNIVNLEVPAGGSYDLQGQLSESVEPPAPLLLSNNRWEFQDANWFPDFSMSAQKMLWFYRKSRNVTADGVIAINATVLERLLAVIGPMTDEKRGLTITSDNALPTIQQVVEEGPEKKDNKPKQIIADLAPKFLEYFKNIKPENLLPILTNLQESLEQKEIQAYFTDNKTENTIKSFGWAGKIISTNDIQDYLMVINTNIQGQKSDANIKQNISHQAVIQSDGSILDSVVITREHTGQNEEKLYGQTNIDYIRVYVPEGSELVSAGGFTWPDENKFKVPAKWTTKDLMLAGIEQELKFDEASGTRITKEFGKTAFGNWIITEPGQTSQAQFVYKLPFKATVEVKTENNQLKKIFGANEPSGRYQLVAQKQSGCESNFESQIIFPDGWKPKWKDGQNMTLAANGAAIPSMSLKKDTIWSLVMTKLK